jgi:two-component system sensor histidine kinase KdpD
VFYRVRAGDKQPAGTGLGLSICRGLIEAHGGQIAALSGPGSRGTTIAFWLPVDALPPIEGGDEDEREPKGGGARR